MGKASNIFALLVVPCALACSACGSCRSNTSSTASSNEQLETLQLVRVVTELRLAPNDQKRPPLERLRSLSCTASKVCAAKSACLDAFDHHVQGVEIGHRLRAILAYDSQTPPKPGVVVQPLRDSLSDAQSDEPSDVQSDRQDRPAFSDGEKAALLIKMNFEVEEGRRLMPRCNEAMGQLRSAAK